MGCNENGDYNNVDYSKVQSAVLEIIKNTITSIVKISLGGDDQHIELLLVSDDFIHKTRLERHKIINKSLQNMFNSGEIHAVSMKLYTVDEYNKLY